MDFPITQVVSFLLLTAEITKGKVPYDFFFPFLAVANQHPQSLNDEKNLGGLMLEGRFPEHLQTSGNNCRGELL